MNTKIGTHLAGLTAVGLLAASGVLATATGAAASDGSGSATKVLTPSAKVDVARAM